MKKMIMTIGLMFFSQGSWGESNLSCKSAHEFALNKCRAYQSQASAADIESLSYETRVRAAQKEKQRTLYLGRACAVAQNHCANTCAQELEVALRQGQDWGTPADFNSDCREGQIAKHRHELHKRYRAFEAMTFSPMVNAERRQPLSFDFLSSK